MKIESHLKGLYVRRRTTSSTGSHAADRDWWNRRHLDRQ